MCDNGMGIPVEHCERVFDRFLALTDNSREKYTISDSASDHVHACRPDGHGGMILAEKKPHKMGSVVHVAYQMRRSPACCRACLLKHS